MGKSMVVDFPLSQTIDTRCANVGWLYTPLLGRSLLFKMTRVLIQETQNKTLARQRGVFCIIDIAFLGNTGGMWSNSAWPSAKGWSLIRTLVSSYMGASINTCSPKCMVYIGKSYQNGWFGGTAHFGTLHVVVFRWRCRWTHGYPIV